MSIRGVRSPHGTFELHVRGVARVRQQVRQSHTALDEGVTAWLHKPPSPPLRLYLHALCVEDITMQSVLRQGAPLFTSFWPNVGGRANVAALCKYARAVYASTDAYLVELPSDGLSRIVDHCKLGLGRRTMGRVIRRFIVQELAHICCEIAGRDGSSGTAGIHPSLRSSSPVLAHAGGSPSAYATTAVHPPRGKNDRVAVQMFGSAVAPCSWTS
jgi:hypothetical protein